MNNPKYKRVLLKVSGEALLGNQDFGIDYKPVEMMAHEVKSILDEGVQEDLLQIMILREDSADEADEFIPVLQGITAGVDQTDPVVELIHVLRAFVDVDDVSVDLGDGVICLIDEILCFASA